MFRPAPCASLEIPLRHTVLCVSWLSAFDLFVFVFVFFFFHHEHPYLTANKPPDRRGLWSPELSDAATNRRGMDFPWQLLWALFAARCRRDNGPQLSATQSPQLFYFTHLWKVGELIWSALNMFSFLAAAFFFYFFFILFFCLAELMNVVRHKVL